MTMVLEKATTNGRPGEQPRVLTSLDMSVAELEASLDGTCYPAEKRDLISQAEINDSIDDIIAFLNLLPEGKYLHPSAVSLLALIYLVV